MFHLKLINFKQTSLGCEINSRKHEDQNLENDNLIYLLARLIILTNPNQIKRTFYFITAKQEIKSYIIQWKMFVIVTLENNCKG